MSTKKMFIWNFPDGSFIVCLDCILSEYGNLELDDAWSVEAESYICQYEAGDQYWKERQDIYEALKVRNNPGAFQEYEDIYNSLEVQDNPKSFQEYEDF